MPRQTLKKSEVVPIETALDSLIKTPPADAKKDARSVVKGLRSKIRAAKKAGHDIETIVSTLKAQGLNVSVRSVKQYAGLVRRSKKTQKPSRSGAEKQSGKSFTFPTVSERNDVSDLAATKAVTDADKVTRLETAKPRQQKHVAETDARQHAGFNDER